MNLGPGGKELTLQPVPAPAGQAAEPSDGQRVSRPARASAVGSSSYSRHRGEGLRGRGASRSAGSAASSGDPISPAMAVVAAVRAWQASPPTGGQLIRPPAGSPRSDRPPAGAEQLLAAEHPCTVCGEVKQRLELQRHPTLPVVSCESCARYFLSDGRPDQWARYSNGKERYCSWCAHNNQCHEEGNGVVVECSREGCPKVFCTACITRNFGRKHFHQVTNSSTWQCYACKPEILKTLASYEVVAAEAPESGAPKPAVSKARSALSKFLEDWLAKHPECLVNGKVQAPDMAVRKALADECRVPVARVSDWFWDQNRRRNRGKRSGNCGHPPGPGTKTEAPGRCTACGNAATLVAHDLLAVKVCRSCFSALHGLATCAAKDRPSGAAPACRWCGRTDAPTVTCTDTSCPSGGHGYCETCITRNFSYTSWKTVVRSYTLGQWSCYACQPEPLRRIPELGCRVSVAFEGEGTSIGRIVGIDGNGMTPGQLRVQFDPPGSEPWLIDPAVGHLFTVLPAPGDLPRSACSNKPTLVTGRGDTSDAASPGPSPRSGWTQEMQQRLIALVERDGTGDWQRKTELLGYGHTGKQLSNKWRSMVQYGGAPRTFVVSSPKARKPAKKSAPPASVTVMYKGETYDVPLPEAASADARGARLETKIRAELQMLPGQRFVLIGPNGKVSLATAATHPGCTFAAHIVDKRRRGIAQVPPALRQQAGEAKVGTTPKRTSTKRPSPGAAAQPAPKKAARTARPQPAAAATPGSKGQQPSASAPKWIQSLALGDYVDCCDRVGEWHAGKIVDLGRSQVRAARHSPCWIDASPFWPPSGCPSLRACLPLCALVHLTLCSEPLCVRRRPWCTSRAGTRGTTSGWSAAPSGSAGRSPSSKLCGRPMQTRDGGRCAVDIHCVARAHTHALATAASPVSTVARY